MLTSHSWVCLICIAVEPGRAVRASSLAKEILHEGLNAACLAASVMTARAHTERNVSSALHQSKKETITGLFTKTLKNVSYIQHLMQQDKKMCHQRDV